MNRVVMVGGGFVGTVSVTENVEALKGIYSSCRGNRGEGNKRK